jgi:inner membrane protein
MTFGHAAIALAVARAYAPRGARVASALRCALLVAVGFLPDIDFTFRAGASLAPFSHRGATHSVPFALAVATIAALGAHAFGARRRGVARLFVVVALVLGSHGVLDALGTRGRPVMLLWPFTYERFTLARVLPPAPFPPKPWTADFWSRAPWELAFSAPFVAYWLLPRARRRE